MAKETLKDKCAIVGTGETEYSYHSDRPVFDMEMEACLKAIADAGLKAKDIDGIINVARPAQPLAPEMAHYLGIKDLCFSPGMNLGGGTAPQSMGYAAMAIESGLAHNVLCFYGSGRIGGGRRDGFSVAPGGGEGRGGSANPAQDREFEQPFGFVSANCVAAMEAQRYMYETGATTDQFAQVVIIERRHAALNDNALAKAPLTLEEYYKSRMIVRPLRLLDITRHADGSAALVVSSAERAKDLKQPPVYIMGFGEGVGEQPMDLVSRKNINQLGVKYAAPKAFAMAGVTPKDVDFLSMFEAYSVTLLRYLEDIGFVKYGEAGPFVAEGRIELGRDLPCNTNGGQLCGAWIEAWNQVLEGARQLRGHAGKAQVKDAKIGAVSTWGGNGDHLGSVLILRR